MKNRKLPCVPKHILRAHKVSEPGDHRFMAAARLLQALWREERNLPIGSCHDSRTGLKEIGSLISEDCGLRGRSLSGNRCADRRGTTMDESVVQSAVVLQSVRRTET